MSHSVLFLFCLGYILQDTKVLQASPLGPPGLYLELDELLADGGGVETALLHRQRVLIIAGVFQMASQNLCHRGLVCPHPHTATMLKIYRPSVQPT